MEHEFANYKILVNGKAIAYCVTREDAVNRCHILRSQGYDPVLVFAPKCRELFG